MQSTYDLSSEELVFFYMMKSNIQDFKKKISARYEDVKTALAHTPELQQQAQPPAVLPYVEELEVVLERLFVHPAIQVTGKPSAEEAADYILKKLDRLFKK